MTFYIDITPADEPELCVVCWHSTLFKLYTNTNSKTVIGTVCIDCQPQYAEEIDDDDDCCLL